ncbi:MAG TPA: hypothetical protein VFE63_09985 [Roseiarcus sp.]|jgi:hypothetical protein|nr:hypothetical protein [Roseiarcus sp.]
MGKATGKAALADHERTPERAALAEAISVRDEAEQSAADLARTKERARADRVRAIGEIDEAKERLRWAREAARANLVDAYASGGGIDENDPVVDAEAALARAERRYNDLRVITDELDAREAPPGYSVPNTRVEDAARAVVLAHPAVRRLVQDYETARRAFYVYQSTLRWLAARGCIPDDIKKVAPRPHDTIFADPDPAWLAAFEALTRDADAPLPG